MKGGGHTSQSQSQSQRGRPQPHSQLLRLGAVEPVRVTRGRWIGNRHRTRSARHRRQRRPVLQIFRRLNRIRHPNLSTQTQLRSSRSRVTHRRPKRRRHLVPPNKVDRLIPQLHRVIPVGHLHPAHL